MTQDRSGSGERSPARAEISAALTLCLYLFLLIVILVMGRSVGSALFLHRFDGRGLALVYMLVAVTVAGLVTLLEIIGRRTSPHNVAWATLAFIGLVSSAAAWTLTRMRAEEHPAFCALLYLAIESLAFVATVQFWATANRAFSFDQARRLYVFIGAGGIVGSIAGGLITRAAADWHVAHTFLFIAAIIPAQLALVFVFRSLAPRGGRTYSMPPSTWTVDHAADLAHHDRVHLHQSPPANESLAACDTREDSAADSGTTIAPAGKRLARAFGLVSLMMVFSTTLVDFYFKMFADFRYAGDVGALTSFFGGFYLCVGLATLLSQSLLTPLLLRRGAAFAGLLSSPLALTIVGLANVFRPGLWMAGLFKLSDSVMTHSVYRSCQEVLYTPLPTGWVPRIKSLSDGIYGRYGLLLAGSMLVCIWPLLETRGPTSLLPCILVAMAAWAIAIARLKREFHEQSAGSAGAHAQRTGVDTADDRPRHGKPASDDASRPAA